MRRLDAPGADIVAVARRICDEMAGILERYAAVSGEGILEMPEGFLRDLIFDRLGDVLTMTLESNTRRVWKWNYDYLIPKEYNNGRRPDLILFTGDDPGYDPIKKQEMGAFSLVEIKKWFNLNSALSDLKKITDWFRWLDCPHGMFCAFLEVPYDEGIRQMRAAADAAGHQVTAGRIARPVGTEVKTYQAFAQIVSNQRLLDVHRGRGLALPATTPVKIS